MLLSKTLKLYFNIGFIVIGWNISRRLLWLSRRLRSMLWCQFCWWTKTLWSNWVFWCTICYWRRCWIIVIGWIETTQRIQWHKCVRMDHRHWTSERRGSGRRSSSTSIQIVSGQTIHTVLQSLLVVHFSSTGRCIRDGWWGRWQHSMRTWHHQWIAVRQTI